MKTRLQARLEQTSNPVASPGANPPRRCRLPLQGNAGVDAVNELGGNQTVSARGGRGIELLPDQPDQETNPTFTEHTPKKCLQDSCRTCPFFREDAEIKSTITGRIYKTINNRKCPLECTTNNVIYLIECCHCHIQYIGETSQMIRGRLSDHRSRIKNHNDTKKETLITNHFNYGMCQGKSFTIGIVETLSLPAKKNGQLDPVATTIRRKREEYWMEALQTIHPYGLNNRHGNNMEQRNEQESVRQLFHRKRRKRYRRFHANKTLNVMTAEQVFQEIKNKVQEVEEYLNPSPEKLQAGIKYAEKIIHRMKRTEVKKLGMLASEESTQDSCIPHRLLLIIIDMTTDKIFVKKDKQKDIPKKRIEIPFIVRYVNHWIEKINLAAVMRDEQLIRILPSGIIEKGTPTVVYKYGPTVRGKLFNYKETVSEFRDNNQELNQCECSSSQYMDTDHKHVVTGNLRIIQNNKLRGLFRKGPNYREKKTMNWNTALRTIKEDIGTFITKWSSKTKKPVEFFTEWKVKVLETIEGKYNHMKKTSQCQPVRQVLRTPECVKELERLKELYVLVPIDKAANNIGFVCKSYFLQVLQQETLSPTYITCNQPEEDIINSIAENSRAMNVPVLQENMQLPPIHATIKMHKDPVKFRFIIGARKCVLKQAAKRLVKILQLIMKIHRNYCSKIRFFTGIERNWIIESNAPVLDDIKKINEKRNAKNIRTYDFSTLYTKIPLEDLKEELKAITEKAFQGGQNQFIQVTSQAARWTNSKKADTASKDEVFKLIDLIVDNAFFKFGNKVFRQCIGIPMGIDPAPQMANLYLYSYESKFMERLTKENYGAAKRFNHTRRFIDDLNTINNHGILEEYHKKGEIYPKELQLNQENKDDKKATFLDLEEEIVDSVIHVKTYDKREAFNFEIVNFPDLSGNIPKKPAYGIYSSQIIRYARSCSRREDLINRVQELTQKLAKKNFKINELKSTLRKCMKRYPWIAAKTGMNAVKHIFSW